MTPPTDCEAMEDPCLPRCTSSTIALGNLDAQIAGLVQQYGQEASPDTGSRLIDGLLARHGVTADDRDLNAARRLAAELVERACDDSTSWIARARVDIATHHHDDAGQALARAVRLGVSPAAVSEEHADLLEARGRNAAALRIRLAERTGHTEPQQMARTACLHLRAGNEEQARELLGEALRTYTSPSPLPLASMLFNWGHTLQHQGQDEQAAKAYRTVTAYLPPHARARRALAELGAHP
ncbi:hypothetical protein IF655_20595 [Streptomyces sp. DSM 110735]|uniref:hypothetical protein n=1 Tax=Streptomyces sp. DSM 110735 TaxID=2775031 RepID=UPI0018F66514|nr:hypothetical protein [Streptomyces sp. DSM 110735]MBJ7905688.1 hypothetical protein [Streptomyces sp. DSM 110735]